MTEPSPLLICVALLLEHGQAEGTDAVTQGRPLQEPQDSTAGTCHLHPHPISKAGPRAAKHSGLGTCLPFYLMTQVEVVHLRSLVRTHPRTSR